VVARVEQLLQRAGGSAQTNLAGSWVARRRYDRLLVQQRRDRAAPEPFRYAVNVPGETLLPDQGLRILVSVEPGIVKSRSARAGTLPSRATISRESVGRKKVFVRSWNRGDRIRPTGMKGSKKLQDIFVDQKVPVEQRTTVPVFECAGEIVWIPGYRVARGWEVRDPELPAVHFRVEWV